MKFKVDENLSEEVSELLRRRGHDAIGVRAQDLGGAADTTIAEVCRVEGRILLTLDTDFANVRAFPPSRYSGLVVFRIVHPDLDQVVQLVDRWLESVGDRDPSGCLWVVDERRVRRYTPDDA